MPWSGRITEIVTDVRTPNELPSNIITMGIIMTNWLPRLLKNKVRARTQTNRQKWRNYTERRTGRKMKENLEYNTTTILWYKNSTFKVKTAKL